MHPTKSIKNQKSSELENKKIILGITGSIAAIMSVKLSRELIRHGAEVQAVMSDSARKIINPISLKYGTGNEVITEITGDIEHVREVGENGDADLFLIAPSTANTISKIAAGIDDTTVTTFATAALSTKIPILIAPAMHESMMNQSIVFEKIEYLKNHNVQFINPDIKEEKAKLCEISEIIFRVKKELLENDLEGKKVMITGGPTYTELDDIRIITNKSTGETGKEIALEAAKRGGEVTFIHGELKTEPPYGVKNKFSPSYKEMKDSVLNELNKREYDAFISTAAVSDFKTKKRNKKLSSKHSQQIELEPTEKIIEKVSKEFPELGIIPFKLEKNLKKARKNSKKLLNTSYLVIGNKLNQINQQKKQYLFQKDDKKEVIELTKKGLAKKLMNDLSEYEG